MMAEPAPSQGMSQSSFDRRRNDLHMNDRVWLEMPGQNANVPKTLWEGESEGRGVSGPPTDCGPVAGVRE